MATADITAHHLRAVLEYTPETGLFIWRFDIVGRHMRAGAIAGHHDAATGYVAIRIKGRLYRAHRLAWLYMTGEWPVAHIDHIDGNPANNRFENLRQATNQENMWNRRRPVARSKTGVLGVTMNRHGSRYVAHIKINGKKTRLGSFMTAEEAHAAYVDAKRKYHPTNTL